MAEDCREKRRLIAVAAKCLALVWAGWCTFCVLSSGLSDETGMIGTLKNGFWFGPAALVIALIALRWEMLGGVLLVLTGIAWSIVYPVDFSAGTATVVFMLLTLVAPPLIAGIMLLARWCGPKENTK